MQLPPDPAPSHVIAVTSSALIEALAARLGYGSPRSARGAPQQQPVRAERFEPRLRLGDAVTALTLDGEAVVVSGGGFSLRAIHVVSTLPPNLFAQSITRTVYHLHTRFACARHGFRQNLPHVDGRVD